MFSNPGFRKIDVDQFSENAFKDDDNPDAGSPASPAIDDKHVQKLCSQGKFADAIKYILSFDAANGKDLVEPNLMIQTMLGVKASEIDGIVAGLNTEQLDLVMKYIYRGFESPSENRSAHLLVWHQKTCSKSGLGSIVRVLAEKRRF